MNELNLKKRDYLEAKGNAEHYSEILQEKKSEIAELEADLADAQNELKELQNRLATSNREMAIGRLSTDQFMELKREIAEKENKVNILTEAVSAQKGAMAMINDDHNINRKDQNEFLKRTAKDLSGQFADDIAALAGDRIQDLTHALVTSKGKSRAFTSQERQRDREAIYLAIGEALCRRVFPNDTGSVECIPDLFQSRRHIGDLIETAPE
jgi:chromosome segregation ATPase